MAELANHYLQPMDVSREQELTSSQDSGVSSMAGGGQVNPSFLPSSDCSDIETSFSDGQKLSSTQQYVPSKSTRLENKDNEHPTSRSEKDLSLPPPPEGSMWLPVSSHSHSADGVIGYPGYPSWPANYYGPNYVHPSMLHPSVQSLPAAAGAITPEEHRLLARFRQEKSMQGYPSGDGSVSSPGADSPTNLYEEVPAYLYRTHNNVNQGRLKQSPDGRAPPHLPPISSLPSSSQASGLDSIHKGGDVDFNPGRKKKENPLYDSNEVYSNDEIDEGPANFSGQAENKLYLEKSEYLRRAHVPHRCYCISLVLVTVLAVASLAIVLLTSFGILNINMKVAEVGTSGATTGAVSGRLNSSDVEINAFLSSLQNNISRLAMESQNQLEQITQLNSQVLSLETKKTQLEELINRTRLDLTSSEMDSHVQLSSLNTTLLSVDMDLITLIGRLGVVNTTLTQAITDVSKEPGPPGANGTQGPQGFLDPSLCRYDNSSFRYDDEVPANANPTLRATTSTLSDTQQKKIIGASCSGSGYSYTALIVQSSSGNGNGYQCQCWFGESGSKICTIHYWECMLPTS